MTSRVFIPLLLGALSAAVDGAVPQTEVVIVGEMTTPGHKIVHPDRDHPAYYLPIMTGFSEMGASLQTGKLPPSEDEVAHQVAVALSHQGYLLAQPGFRVNEKKEIIYGDGTVVRVPSYPRFNRPLEFNGRADDPLTLAMLEAPSGWYSMHGRPEVQSRGRHVPSALVQLLCYVDPDHGSVIQNLPSLVLTIQWGTMHPQNAGGTITQWTATGGIEVSQGVHTPEGANLAMLATLVAGTTWDNLATWQQTELARRTEDDRYFVVLGAYDFQSCLKGHEKILLWSAKMSVTVNQDAKFGDMLALLIKAGESRIGRESTRPEFVTVPLVQDGRVIVGTPEVVPDHADSPAPEKK